MAIYDKGIDTNFINKLLEMGKNKETITIIYESSKDIEETKENLFQLSNLYIEKKDFKNAYILANEAYKLDPENEAFIYNLALINFYLENYNESLRIFETIKPSSKYYKYSLPYIAYCYVQKKEYDKALSLIEIEGFFSSYDENIYLVGLKLIEEKQLDYAIKLFEKFNENKSSFFAIYGLGIAYFANKNFEKAIEYFSIIYVMNKKNRFNNINIDYLYEGLGVSYYENKQYDRAIKILNEAIQKKIENSEIYYYLADSYKKVNDYQNAIKYFTKTLEIENNPEICEMVGDSLFEMNELTLSEEAYKKAYNLSKKRKFYFKLGLVMVTKENFEKAYEIFSNLFKEEQSEEMTIEILKQLTLSCYYTERYEEALVYGKELIEKNIKEERLFLVIINSLFMLNKIKEAEEIIDLSLKYFKNSIPLLYTKGILKSNLHKYEEADKIFSELIEMEENGNYLYAYALVKLQVNQKDKAIELLKRSLKYFEDDTESLYKIGVKFFELGEKEMANKIFLKVLEIDPAHKGAKALIN